MWPPWASLYPAAQVQVSLGLVTILTTLDASGKSHLVDQASTAVVMQMPLLCLAPRVEDSAQLAHGCALDQACSTETPSSSCLPCLQVRKRGSLRLHNSDNLMLLAGCRVRTKPREIGPMS